MSSAGKTLKELYPSLTHVTCVAHLLHNCAMRVRAHFKNIDEVIATIKAATIKNKDCKKDFHDADLPSPPDPVITRWATWLRAALYYRENLPAVCTIANNWTSAGLLVSRAKNAINVEGLVSDLVKINQYRTLAANVEFLEGSACTITKAYGLLKNMQFDDDPCAIKDYIVGNSNSIFLLPFVIIWFKNCRSAASGSLNVLKLFVCKLGYFSW